MSFYRERKMKFRLSVLRERIFLEAIHLIKLRKKKMCFIRFNRYQKIDYGQAEISKWLTCTHADLVYEATVDIDNR